jgi:hypothetical protein
VIDFELARLDPAVEARKADWSKMLFGRFGLRDYARFDFRVAADGRPKLMEINPNPACGHDGKLAIMAGFAGLSYARMLKNRDRGRHRPPRREESCRLKQLARNGQRPVTRGERLGVLEGLHGAAELECFRRCC